MDAEYQKKWQKVRRSRLKEQGLCTSCGKMPPQENKKCCEACLQRQRKATKKWKDATCKIYKEAGLCSCGRPPKAGGKICEKCAERGLRNYYKDKERGICAYCKNTVMPGTTRCRNCANKHKEEGRRIKAEVFVAYGGAKCNCCGEVIEKFLTLDHVNNDGNKHRKQVGRTSVYRWLKANGFPSGYQVLCWNCNIGRHHNGGVCPHKQQE